MSVTHVEKNEGAAVVNKLTQCVGSLAACYINKKGSFQCCKVAELKNVDSGKCCKVSVEM